VGSEMCIRDRFGPTLTPEHMGRLTVDIAADAAYDQAAYLVTADRITPAP